MSGEDVSKAPVNFGVSENRRVARPGEVARSAVPVGHFVTLAGLSFIHSLSTTRVTDGVAGFGARGFGARASRRATRSESHATARARRPARASRVIVELGP